MKPGQIITHKKQIYQLIKNLGKGIWEAKHLASESIVEISVVKISVKKGARNGREKAGIE